MNKAYFDWLTLCTWDVGVYANTISGLYIQNGMQARKIMQYRGKASKDGKIFFGLGSQGTGDQEKAHAMIRFSGPAAHEYRRKASEWEQFYCTRLDMQVTIREPENYNPMALYDAITDIKREMFVSDDGVTVYLGAHRSGMRCRIYQKPVENEKYLRCEFELHKDYATRAWEHYRQGLTSTSEIFETCLDRSKIPARWRAMFITGADTYDELLKHVESRDLDRKLRWLRDTETALERALNNHATAAFTATMIERLHEICQYQYPNFYDT